MSNLNHDNVSVNNKLQPPPCSSKNIFWKNISQYKYVFFWLIKWANNTVYNWKKIIINLCIEYQLISSLEKKVNTTETFLERNVFVVNNG